MASARRRFPEIDPEAEELIMRLVTKHRADMRPRPRLISVTDWSTLSQQERRLVTKGAGRLKGLTVIVTGRLNDRRRVGRLTTWKDGVSGCETKRSSAARAHDSAAALHAQAVVVVEATYPGVPVGSRLGTNRLA